MSRSKNNSRKRARQKRLRAALLHLPFTSHLLTLGWWNWLTRTFEGRMPKGLRVRVPPRARFLVWLRRLVGNCVRAEITEKENCPEGGGHTVTRHAAVGRRGTSGHTKLHAVGQSR